MGCKIYVLKNNLNGKLYVGQSWIPLEQRMGKNGVGYKNSTYLYNAMQKYGSSNFTYTVIDEFESQEEADWLEDKLINELQTQTHGVGYNIKNGGSAGRHSEETKLKISNSLIGREVSAETRSKISQIHKGLKKPEHTKEWKQANSEFMKKRHAEQGHPMQDKHHTDESKAKISAGLMGRKIPEESVKRGAEKRKMDKGREAAIIKSYQDGQTIDSIEEAFGTSRSSIYRLIKRNNITLSNNFTRWIGKEHSEETKEKMAQARTEYWDNKHNNE